VWAALVRVTVPWKLVTLAVPEVGETETAVTATPLEGRTMTRVLVMTPPYEAVMVAATAVVTVVVFTVNVWELVFFLTDTLEGTVRAELLLLSATTVPDPIVAGALRVSVAVAPVPPVNVEATVTPVGYGDVDRTTC
jgi:hypothetical protein